MGMRGTVRCRSTLAYRVHFDGISKKKKKKKNVYLTNDTEKIQIKYHVRMTTIKTQRVAGMEAKIIIQNIMQLVRLNLKGTVQIKKCG